MTNDKLRAFYDERRRKGPGLIALAIVGIINWIVSDVLNFSSLVSQLNIDMSGFKQAANMLLPEFGLFGTLFIVALICWLLGRGSFLFTAVAFNSTSLLVIFTFFWLMEAWPSPA